MTKNHVSIAQQLETLKRLSTELNAMSDALNAAVESVESFLSKTCSVGIATSVPIDNQTTLQYTRLGGKFRLAVRTGDDLKAWSECGREEKFLTIVKLPELLTAMGEAAQERIRQAKEAAALVENLRECLEDRP